MNNTHPCSPSPKINVYASGRQLGIAPDVTLGIAEAAVVNMPFLGVRFECHSCCDRASHRQGKPRLGSSCSRPQACKHFLEVFGQNSVVGRFLVLGRGQLLICAIKMPAKMSPVT